MALAKAASKDSDVFMRMPAVLTIKAEGKQTMSMTLICREQDTNLLK